MYDQPDRCWTAIVMGFNDYWATLPFGGRDSLLAVCNCKVLEVWKRRQCAVAEAQSYDKGRGGRTVTGVHGNVTGIQNETVNGGTKKRVGMCNGGHAWLHCSLEYMVCT